MKKILLLFGPVVLLHCGERLLKFFNYYLKVYFSLNFVNFQFIHLEFNNANISS